MPDQLIADTERRHDTAEPHTAAGGWPAASGTTGAARDESAWQGNTALLALGRLVFGGYFVYNGVNHFKSHQMMAGYARSKDVPLPDVAVAATGAMLVAGGLSIVAGVQPKAGASLIAAFLLGVSPRMHAFWQTDDEQQKMADLVNFTKNMALVGAACFVAAAPEPWPASLG